MNFVRDRADARWLPARHHYALFRLFAALCYRFTKPQPVRGLLLMIDRDQSNFENYTVALWILLTLIAFLAAAVGFIIAIPLALIVIQLPLHTLGPLIRRVWKISGQQATTIATMCLVALAAAYYALEPTWIRFVAWQFFGFLTLNAIVSCILKPRRCILLFTLIAPIALVLLWPYSPLAAIGVLALSHALVLYPTLRPNTQWLGPVITHFETIRNEVWLTIDDGPTSDTRAVLDLFDARNVKATFFVKGTLVDANAELAREIVARGHTIANHSQTHPSGTFWCLGPRRIAEEIEGGNRAIERITGTAPRLFRAPVGMKNPFVHPALAKLNMHLIGWTARGFDAVESDPEKIVAGIVRDLAPGAIIVMHQGREWSVRTLDRVIDAIRERGYELVVPDVTATSAR